MDIDNKRKEHLFHKEQRGISAFLLQRYLGKILINVKKIVTMIPQIKEVIFKVEFLYSKQALKFLIKQDTIVRKRIVKAINMLPNGDVRKLKGKDGYRLRIGSFRVIFNRSGNIIYIEDIDNRGQVYK